MKIINGKYYFTPNEAGTILGISYKTLQRWVERGGRPIKAKTKSRGGQHKVKKIKLECIVTPTGYHYYNGEQIETLASELSELVKITTVKLTRN